jgi:hypothetical protein
MINKLIKKTVHLPVLTDDQSITAILDQRYGYRKGFSLENKARLEDLKKQSKSLDQNKFTCNKNLGGNNLVRS